MTASSASTKSVALERAAATVAFEDVPFRAIVTQSLAGIYVVLDERFMYANETFAGMFGYEREEFIGRRLVDCITPDSVEEVMRNYQLRMRNEVPSIHYFTKGVRKDGSIVHLELHASRVECLGRPALTGVALDVTHRVEAQMRLREVSQRINVAREAERSRLSREVHDVLGGMLTSLKFDLSRVMRRTAAGELHELHGIADEMMGLVQETIATARSISEELRPTSLDLLGLVAALEQTLERFGMRHGLVVQATMPPGALHIPRDSATQIFRIVQQALTNIASHAAATRVELTFAPSSDHTALVLTLRDDGVGIDAQPRRAGAIGIYSMGERAREIGATLDIRQRPEGGTELVLVYPCPQEALGTT